MWSFAWAFWLMVFVVFVVSRRRRHWRRWAAMGPAGYAPYRCGSGRGGVDAEWVPRASAPQARRELEDQQASVDALETRIAQLEERLDFTERLLAGRREPPPSS